MSTRPAPVDPAPDGGPASDEALRDLAIQRARVREATARVGDPDAEPDAAALAAQDAAAAATDAVAALDRLARERSAVHGRGAAHGR